jgi:hypothetical protein
VVSGRLIVLMSDNLITNPGFKRGFTGWTDGTTSITQLTSTKFTLITTGGVNNSKYLVGITNEGGLQQVSSVQVGVFSPVKRIVFIIRLNLRMHL